MMGHSQDFASTWTPPLYGELELDALASFSAHLMFSMVSPSHAVFGVPLVATRSDSVPFGFGSPWVDYFHVPHQVTRFPYYQHRQP